MKQFDVVIVGGGPAGSSCAWQLRDSGLRVLVLDRKIFPRDKTCAGWVTPAVWEELGINLDEYRIGRTLQPIRGFVTGTIHGKVVRTEYDSPVSYGIRRCEFDHFLLRRSEAECRLGVSVRSLERQPQRWIVNGEFEAPLLIGAGGQFCPVAQHLEGGKRPLATLVTAQETEFQIAQTELDKVAVAPEFPELYFCEDLKGYGWCFRKGEFLNIGLGRVESEGLPGHVADFVEFLRLRGSVAANIPNRFRGHAYRLYERNLPLLYDDGVMLIGDSAGLSYPQSGEGIRPAIESGLLAAEVILDASGEYSQEILRNYQAAIVRRLGKPRRADVPGFLPAGWLRSAAAMLLSQRWFAQKVVIDRWFLHSRQTPLCTDRNGSHRDRTSDDEDCELTRRRSEPLTKVN